MSALTAGLLAFVLAVACVGVWMARDLAKQIGALDARFTTLETAFHSAVDELPMIEALRDDISLLKQRSDDHDRNREQLRLAVDESQQQILEEFIIRVVALEQVVDARIDRLRSPEEPTQRPVERAKQVDALLSPPVVAEATAEPVEEPAVSPKEPAPTPAPILVPASPTKQEPNPEAVRTVQTVTANNAPASGPWVVNLLSASTRTEAQKQVDQLSAEGIDAEIHPAVVRDQTWYRIRVVGFATVTDARQFSRKISTQMGLKGVWVARR